MLIKSSTTLRNDYTEISNLAHTNDEPIYITKNGEGDLVLMSIEAFEKKERLLNLKEEFKHRFFPNGTYENERDGDGVKNYSETNPFYLTVEKEMQDVLTRFPQETTLMNIIPNSNFVKVNYAENKYYAVGLIYENKKERYICYGVPDKYSKNPPKELKGYCQFIPLSMFTPFGDGYWMMFQDATFGTCVKMK